MIRWGQPEAFWGLAVCAALAWLFLALLRRRGRLLERLADAAIVPVLVPRRDAGRMRLRLWVWSAAAALAIVALARPQWGFSWQEVRRRGLNIMVVLDTSNSMLAPDLKPSRLQQAKWGIRDLVGRLKGDRIGLVAFAGSSFLQCPQTMDYSAFLMTLEDAYAGLIPRGGTAIEQALRMAIDKFDYSAPGDRVIILITDGEDHEGDPQRVLDELKKKNIRLYAVGVGTADGELIPSADTAGGFLKDRQGNIVKSSLREEPLARLALGTGGAYVGAAPGDFGLDRIYEQHMAELKRDEQESRMAKTQEERFGWFLGAALVLFAIEACMDSRRRRNGRPAEAAS